MKNLMILYIILSFTFWRANSLTFDVNGNKSKIVTNSSEKIVEFDYLNLTHLIGMSSFQGWSRKQRPRNVIPFNGEDEDPLTECYCEVTVNGRSHSVEEAVCGRKGKIFCPERLGCQKTTATVNGYWSVVKACGNAVYFDGRCSPHREHHIVGHIDIRRCFCMGRLCNRGFENRAKVIMVMLLVVIRYISPN